MAQPVLKASSSPGIIIRFLAFVNHDVILFTLPSAGHFGWVATSRHLQVPPQDAVDSIDVRAAVHALSRQLRRCWLWSLLSYGLLVFMMLDDPTIQTDSFRYAILACAFVNMFGAATSTSLYSLVIRLASHFDHAMRNLAKTAATRAADGSRFMNLSVLCAVPNALTRWSLFSTVLALFMWLHSAIRPAGSIPSDADTLLPATADGWTYSNIIPRAHMVAVAAYVFFSAYHFAGAWCEGGALISYVWGGRTRESTHMDDLGSQSGPIEDNSQAV